MLNRVKHDKPTYMDAHSQSVEHNYSAHGGMMNTLISMFLIITVLANFLLYKKAEDIWDENTAKKVFWGALIASFLLGASISTDLSLGDSGIMIWFVIDLGIVSLLSFAFSRRDGSELQILRINVSAPAKLIFDIVGFVASILGIISFLMGR
jgi:hypothetical protein